MTDVGKRIRMDRIMDRKTKNTVIVPMDHGVSTGPIKGLVDMPKIVDEVAKGGANAVLLHKGIIKTGYRGYGEDIGLIMHLSGSTTLGPDSNDKVLVASVEEGIKYGADGVSVHINIGSATEPKQLRTLGKIAEECEYWGMPLLAMMYPRGKDVKAYDVENLKLVARVGAELGADIIKTNYSGSESFREVVDGCPVPVVIAGGEKMENPLDILKAVAGSIKAGGRGVSLGRNIFQYKNPTAMTRAIYDIVHKGATAEEVLKHLNERLYRG